MRNYLKKIKARYDLNKNKKILSLNIEDRKIQKELRKNWLLKIENERRIAVGDEVFISYKEMRDFNDNEDNINSNSINLTNDYQLIESTNIINDFVKLENFENKKIISSIK